jgi:hypothetical protein
MLLPRCYHYCLDTTALMPRRYRLRLDANATASMPRCMMPPPQCLNTCLDAQRLADTAASMSGHYRLRLDANATASMP